MSDVDLKIVCLPPYRLFHIQGDPEAMDCIASGGADSSGRAAVAGPRIFSVSPDEWLLLGYSKTDTVRRFVSKARRSQIRVTDVSDAMGSVSIEGGRARSALAATTDTPLIVRSATPQQYARIRIGGIDVIMQCIHERGFELHVNRNMVLQLADFIESRSGGKIAARLN
jgi:heterotetrameric sarcosine oxidase gamma subunit